MAYAQQVVVVPGYGMAVAQAQHAVKDMADLLEERGVEVKYAIHPVAGRMPGHMNVLLAEADVPYEALREMDEINGEFPRTDVTLVIGANDVTNPAARTDPSSPIHGMPILDVDRSRSVIVLKRSMNSGFAGIDNPLFYAPTTTDAVRRRQDLRHGGDRGAQGAVTGPPPYRSRTCCGPSSSTLRTPSSWSVRTMSARRISAAFATPARPPAISPYR